MDEIYEDGRVLITARAMGKLRRCRWEEMVGWEEKDMDRRYHGDEMLSEDMQDYPNGDHRHKCG